MRHVTKKFTALFCASTAAMFFAACDDSDEEPDARIPNMFDANNGPPIDGGIDGGDGIDAAPGTAVGSVAVHEIEFANQFLKDATGSGVQISISIEDSTKVVAPVIGTGAPGTCSAWSYTKEQAEAPPIDEGTVQVTVTPPKGGPAQPVFPPCIHSPRGYICPAAMGTGGAIASAGAPGAFTFTDPDATFSAANVGNYLNITGSASNDGLFPIIGIAAATTVIIGSQSGAMETLPATAGWVALAGIGPSKPLQGTPPAPAEKNWLDDEASVTVKLTPGPNALGEGFEVTVADVGDRPDFPEATLDLLTNIPMDGEAFTVTCGDAAACGDAQGLILNIITTDGPVGDTLPPTMPPVVEKRVQVRCAFFSTSFEVPADISKLLMESGATRIQATLLRSRLQSPSGFNVVAGHGAVGYTDVAAEKPAK